MEEDPPRPTRQSQPKRSIPFVECLVLALLLGCTAGILALVIATYQQARRSRSEIPTIAPILAIQQPKEPESPPGASGDQVRAEATEITEIAPDSSPSLPPPIDLTAEALNAFASSRKAILDDLAVIDERVESLRSQSEATENRVREQAMLAELASDQIRELTGELAHLQTRAETAIYQRDLLEKHRDEALRKRQDAIENPGTAILPYRRPPGTSKRQHPIK